MRLASPRRLSASPACIRRKSMYRRRRAMPTTAPFGVTAIPVISAFARDAFARCSGAARRDKARDCGGGCSKSRRISGPGKKRARQHARLLHARRRNINIRPRGRWVVSSLLRENMSRSHIPVLSLAHRDLPFAPITIRN